VLTGGGLTVLPVTSDEDVPVTSDEKRKRPIWKWARWLTVVAISLGVMIYLGIIIYQLVLHVPYLLARRHTNPSVESAYISGVAALLGVGVGVGATAAVAIAALWWSRSTNKATLNAAKESTDKTVKAARETNEATLAAAREAQFPDRYSNAIQQLGSKNLDVRIGGIYALEGIAADYAKHHTTVMELLAAFIREHSGEPSPAPGSGPPPDRTTQPDVQTALTVIGRRKAGRDARPIDLTGANLTDAKLADAKLVDADLTRAVLTRAVLTRADLTRADLTDADLTRADLTGADLASADFGVANLAYANLTGANLTEANFFNANLTDANLTDANLTRAKFYPEARLTGAYLCNATLTGAVLNNAILTDANLTGTDFTDAVLGVPNLGGEYLDLTGARFPRNVQVPEDWVRDPDSGLLKRAGEEPGPARPASGERPMRPEASA
jgi:uncharacterized protein YjbI with pentapeptide repeats